MTELSAVARRAVEDATGAGASDAEAYVSRESGRTVRVHGGEVESLTAATQNAAACLGLGAEVGSIEAGKRADLVLLDAPNLLHLAYHYGVNPVAAVVKGGRIVHRV